jgi:TonB family protein
MVPRSPSSLPVLGALLAAALGCAKPPPPPPPAPPPAPETDEQRCARLAATPHGMTPPVKLSGDPAVLTPEGADAGVKGPVRVTCSISRRGRLHLCRVLDKVPPSLDASILAKLDTWRYQPATDDGVPVAQEHTLSVPLVPAPAGYAPPRPGPNDPIPFTDKMRVPQLTAGAPYPQYPRRAREMCAEGKVVAQCVITEEGALDDCDILVSVRYLDEGVLDLLGQRKYTPIVFKGKRRRVLYTLPFEFKLPHAPRGAPGE